MRLTLALLKRRNVIPGHRYLGKHQMPIIIRPWTLDVFRKELQVEEKNMFYLRHPYLTPEQEFGHAQELGKQAKFIAYKQVRKAAVKVMKSVRMENYLGHLNVANKWGI